MCKVQVWEQVGTTKKKLRSIRVIRTRWLTFDDVRQELRRKMSSRGVFEDNYHFLRKKGQSNEVTKVKRKTEKRRSLGDNESKNLDCFVTFFQSRRERYKSTKTRFLRSYSEGAERPFTNRMVTYEPSPPGRRGAPSKFFHRGRAHNVGKGVYHWHSRQIQDKEGRVLFKVFQSYKDFRRIAKRRSKQQGCMSIYPGIRVRTIQHHTGMMNQKIRIVMQQQMRHVQEKKKKNTTKKVKQNKKKGKGNKTKKKKAPTPTLPYAPVVTLNTLPKKKTMTKTSTELAKKKKAKQNTKNGKGNKTKKRTEQTFKCICGAIVPMANEKQHFAGKKHVRYRLQRQQPQPNLPRNCVRRTPNT